MRYPIIEINYSAEDLTKKSQRPECSDYKIEYELTDSILKARLTAKKEITLHDFSMSFEQKYEDGVKVFSNGYQSWSPSREFSREDKMQSVNPAAKGKLLMLSGLTSDVRFVELPKRSGEFYSHTYTYFKNGEELTLIGSLCEKTGFTVFYHNYNLNTFKIDKDVEGITLRKDESYELLDIVMFKGEYDEVFDKYFGLMDLPKPRIDHLSGYTSWYNYFQNINEEIILRDLDSLDTISDYVSIFQVDDGYETFVGDWLDENPEKFPNGMKYIADKVHEKGYLAGLWLAPFNAEKDSRIYKEHPEWLVKDENGKPLFSVLNWSGTYTLDIYNE
ncbi:MAG: alpha-galactosidase, partial [Clostridia bacterium]|nr:alpha-galactosidase [Clostridia bacterium]